MTIALIIIIVMLVFFVVGLFWGIYKIIDYVLDLFRFPGNRKYS